MTIAKTSVAACINFLDITHCNTLQHTATHCNTLQHTATHCNTLQHTATHCNTMQHTSVTACINWLDIILFEEYLIFWYTIAACPFWVKGGLCLTQRQSLCVSLWLESQDSLFKGDFVWRLRTVHVYTLSWVCLSCTMILLCVCFRAVYWDKKLYIWWHAVLPSLIICE